MAFKTWHTFDEWKELGYFIKKGSKATDFDGVKRFSNLQVEKVDASNRTKQQGPRPNPLKRNESRGHAELDIPEDQYDSQEAHTWNQ